MLVSTEKKSLVMEKKARAFYFGGTARWLEMIAGVVGVSRCDTVISKYSSERTRTFPQIVRLVCVAPGQKARESLYSSYGSYSLA